MNPSVRPELPTAALRSSQPTHAAVDNSAPFTTHPESTYKSGKVAQTNGATSGCRRSGDAGAGASEALDRYRIARIERSALAREDSDRSYRPSRRRNSQL